MNSRRRIPLPLVAIISILIVGVSTQRSATSQVTSGPAGQTGPAITLDSVLVGDPGNVADPFTGYGAVAAAFRIATTELTIAQYVVFLNAVAQIPPNDTIGDLYKAEMSDSGEDPGVLIDRKGSGTAADPYIYSPSVSTVWPSAEQRPVAWVTWFDAARFANWMHNGQGVGGTETGAYTLIAFQQSGEVTRNADAKFWIPSEDEWYKAAYYDPTKTGPSQYWKYPTSSDLPPRFAKVSENPSAPAANFQNIYKKSGMGVLVPVGSYPTSLSHYGTLDQGGNVWEWTEAAYPDPATGPNRIVRGGSWGPDITPLEKFIRRDYGPMGSRPFYFDDDTGFRLAMTQ